MSSLLGNSTKLTNILQIYFQLLIVKPNVPNLGYLHKLVVQPNVYAKISCLFNSNNYYRFHLPTPPQKARLRFFNF